MHSRFLSHLEQNQTTLSAGISFVRKIGRSGRRREAPVTPPPWRLDGPKWLPNAPHDLPRPPNGWKSAVHLILDYMRVEILFLASIWASEDVLMLFPVFSCPDAHPCTADPRRLGKVENWPPRRPQTTKWMPETDSPPKKTSRMNLPHILRCW